MKFGIGQSMRRHEDPRLITGRGCYTDDVLLPRMTHAFVLRSPVAHAHIKRIDAAAAQHMPGVLFVATGEDVRADGLGDVPCMVPLANRDGTPRHDTPRPVLAVGKVRHVGTIRRSSWRSPSEQVPRTNLGSCWYQSRAVASNFQLKRGVRGPASTLEDRRTKTHGCSFWVRGSGD